MASTELEKRLLENQDFSTLSGELKGVVTRLSQFVQEREEGAGFDRTLFLEEMEPLSSPDRERVMDVLIQLSDTEDGMRVDFTADALAYWVSDRWNDDENTRQPMYVDELSAVVAQRDPREILEMWASVDVISQDILKAAVFEDPIYYIQRYSYYDSIGERVGIDPKDIPDDVIAASLDDIKKYHFSTDDLIEQFGDRPFFDQLIKQRLEDNTLPARDILYKAEFFAQKPYGKDLFFKAVKDWPSGVASEADVLQNLPYADELFRIVLDRNPISVVSSATLMRVVVDKPYFQEYVEKGLQENPLSMARFALIHADQPFAETLYNEAVARFEQHLADKPEHSGRLVRMINDLHDEADAIRFVSVENFSASAMYDLTSTGRGDLYTSTFNGLFDRFLLKMADEKLSFSEMLAQDPRRLENLPSFLEAVASFGRTDDFLRQLGDDEQVELVDTLFNTIDSEEDNNEFIYSTAAFLQSMSAGQYDLGYVETKIMQGYQNTEGFLKEQYGVLGGWLASQAGHEISPDHAAFFKALDDNPQYHLPDLRQKNVNSLLDENGRNYQLHVFYDDEDGHLSYQHYKRFMQQDGWSIEESEEEGIALFQKAENGREVYAFVSLPAADSAAAEYLKEQAEEGGVHFSVVAHRGHSYHVEWSLDLIDEHAQIVFLGSCGGYENVEDVLESSADAHILSTSGTGTMYVNDPLLTWINRSILRGDAVEWSDIGHRLSRMENNDASFYRVPPDNLALLFSKKFEELQNEETPKQGLSNNFDAQVGGENTVPVSQPDQLRQPDGRNSNEVHQQP